ncbi:helix-turn-helix domain-containing protein [Chryseobacterium sp.]|uniref:helix-turn-helix domain-containing protein n=1 Tax=Chryseobacterium sp. TaxID=1871047 RepID=UPI00388CFD5A
MAKQIQKGIDYRRLYRDLISYKYPNKIEECRSILEKDNIIGFDILMLQKKLAFNFTREDSISDQRYKSYDESTIKKILQFQEKNQLNNTQLALHFKLSRNTVSKWKKLFTNSIQL